MAKQRKIGREAKERQRTECWARQKDPSCLGDSHMNSGNGFVKLPISLVHPCRSIQEVIGLVLNKTLKNMNLTGVGLGPASM